MKDNLRAAIASHVQRQPSRRESKALMSDKKF